MHTLNTSNTNNNTNQLRPPIALVPSSDTRNTFHSSAISSWHMCPNSHPTPLIYRCKHAMKPSYKLATWMKNRDSVSRGRNKHPSPTFFWGGCKTVNHLSALMCPLQQQAKTGHQDQHDPKHYISEPLLDKHNQNNQSCRCLPLQQQAAPGGPAGPLMVADAKIHHRGNQAPAF
mmetsp:Transcript_12737/g.15377  ORF Transcript_12737/g.15377 Transcript_12737/m.15377 type:complete len:174 (-) Transcript_12737:133-654(-)